MRSLKECYEIAKKYHTYWTGSPDDTEFMCHAIGRAHTEGKLTREEAIQTTDDVRELIDALDSGFSTLKGVFSSLWGKQCTAEAVKAFWDEYIDNLENQDG